MKSEKTQAESGRLVLNVAAAIAASVACIGHAAAQDAVDVKVPRPLPHMDDVKTPSNNPSQKPSIPAVPRASTGRLDNAAPISKPAVKQVHAPHLDSSRVYFDEPGDGSVWALGATYKASFGPNGATYIPFLGSCAPRNFPISFSLKSIAVGDRALQCDSFAVASRTGTGVVYDRGEVVERYEVTTDSVEQEFEFASLPAGGDLVLQLDVGTDLVSAQTDEGLRWSNDLGAVSYSRAILVDAAGRRTPVLTERNGGAIEIRVPSALLSEASFPIVIDPVVTTFTVDTSTNDDLNPDIAYDSTNDVYEVVWERVFSAADHDCYSQLQDSSGATIAGSFATIDFTADSWVRPRTANNLIATQFLVAAQVTPTAGGMRVIKGRTRNASSTSTGHQFQISDPAITDDQLNVSVGGDPNPASPTYYCVTWQRVFIAGTDTDIFARLVLSDSTLLGTSTIFIDNSSGTLDQLPSVSRSDGNAPATGQDWTIVWQRVSGSSDRDIRGAQVHWDGTITTASFSIDATAFDDTLPSASSVVDGNGIARNYMVVFQRFYGPDDDIQAYLMNGATPIASTDLSSLENDGLLFQDQIQPKADSDGTNFAVTYSEQFGSSTTDYDIYISSFNGSASIGLIEAHQNLAFSSDPETLPAITARHSGGAVSQRFAVAWSDEFGATNHDVHGGLYDAPLIQSYCFPGSDGVIGCPCSNPGTGGTGCNNSHNTGGAALGWSGVPSVSADTLFFGQFGELPTSLSIFLQGNASLPNGATFGDGVRCAGGNLKRLFTHNAAGGSVFAPTGADSSVSVRSAALGDVIGAGTTRYYQVYYRDPNLTFCSAGFNVGNALKVAWVD